MREAVSDLPPIDKAAAYLTFVANSFDEWFEYGYLKADIPCQPRVRM